MAMPDETPWSPHILVLLRPEAPCCGFSLANSATIDRGMPGFSFSQTEPIQGQNSGLLWHNGTGEGQQYHHDPENSHNGFDSFSSFQMNHNGNHGSNATNRSQWNASPDHVEPVQMSRLASQESTGAHAHRASHASSYDQSRSSSLYAPVSQAPYISSSRSDVTGRSSPVDSGLYTPVQPFELQAFDNYPFPGTEDITGGQNTFHRASVNGVSQSRASMNAGPSFNMFATTDDTFASLSNGSNNLANHAPISQDSVIFDPSAIVDSHSPTMWDDNLNLESQRSSPTLLDDWVLPPAQMMTSSTNSPLDYSPSLEGLSPRIMRKPIGPRQSKVVSDLASRQQRHQGTSETSDESYRMVGRSSLEFDNTARDHPLYQNVTPKADGLYHCPWEGQDGCQHKPEKLKCNYDKFVDSHLKPYRCKVHACENSRFSSTACLLRHEREAHAMHGHGDKPYLCTYEGCERRVAGNGFPRHWNLRDHMKRVHNDPGTSPKGNAGGSPPPSSAPTRAKKRKLEASDPAFADKVVKRTTTSTVAVQAQEPTMVERYNQSEQTLREIVKQLSDPRNANNMNLLRSASECIKVMAQATQRINPNGTLNFKQPSGPE
ncbi:zinc finger protein [Hyphodiscus hymeniophilus]|uniref:Zinc finger protein n=1 Tax=Hyphodiscus hymeniophilus TaxID=353542 RepID=A0A9P6SLH7_9HELO|nr:zinc finger protein [Hyphodiscus hymeniophilus]